MYQLNLIHWQIYKLLNRFYPLKNQAKWDCSGFLCSVKTRKNLTKRIFVMLDLEYEWFKKQEFTNNDFIIMHHPLIFDSTDIQIKMLAKLKQIGVPILMLHTNFDFDPNGMNFEFAQIFNSFFINNEANHGCHVTLKKAMTLSEIVKLIQTKLQPMQIVYDEIYTKNKVKDIQIILGSGANELNNINFVIKNHHPIDLFITGDMKWHNWQKARDLNLAVIDCHHSTEKIFIKTICKVLKKFLKFNIQIIPVEVQLKLIYTA